MERIKNFVYAMRSDYTHQETEKVLNKFFYSAFLSYDEYMYALSVNDEYLR